MTFTKQHKILLFAALPIFFIAIVAVSSILLKEEKKEIKQIAISTSLPEVSSNIKEERNKAYQDEKIIQAQIDKREKKSDFVLSNYTLLSDEDKLKGKNDHEKEISTDTKTKEIRKKTPKINPVVNTAEESRRQILKEQKILEAKLSKEENKPSKTLPSPPPPDPEKEQQSSPISFNSISLGKKIIPTNKNGTPCFVHGDQTVYQGAIIKLRTGKKIILSSSVIPANTFLYGKCTLANERLHVTITHIQLGDEIISCNLSGYGLDGNKGIHVPGSVQKEANKKSSSSGIKRVGSALGSGINIATGSLLGKVAETATEGAIDALADGTSKAIQQTKVFLKNNEPLFLK